MPLDRSIHKKARLGQGCFWPFSPQFFWFADFSFGLNVTLLFFSSFSRVFFCFLQLIQRYVMILCCPFIDFFESGFDSAWWNFFLRPKTFQWPIFFPGCCYRIPTFGSLRILLCWAVAAHNTLGLKFPPIFLVVRMPHTQRSTSRVGKLFLLFYLLLFFN